MHDLSQLLAPKFDDRLRKHLEGIDITSVSRLTAQRLQENALLAIGLIELVDGCAFEQHYRPLYLAQFHSAEREDPDLIVSRLDDEMANRRHGLCPYRVVGIRDASGEAAGAAQFSVFLHGDYAIPYLQYIYIRPQSRRRDLSEVLHTIVLAVAMADAATFRSDSPPQVPFTLCETTPAVHGSDLESRAAAAERAQIHAKSGSQALMLRRKSNCKILSVHMQPGLEPGEPPVTLVWVLRANPAMPLVLANEGVGKSFIQSYYQSLRDEGFPEENIALAERTVEARLRLAHEFCLIPLSEITREMYVGID